MIFAKFGWTSLSDSKEEDEMCKVYKQTDEQTGGRWITGDQKSPLKV